MGGASIKTPWQSCLATRPSGITRPSSCTAISSTELIFRQRLSIGWRTRSPTPKRKPRGSQNLVLYPLSATIGGQQGRRRKRPLRGGVKRAPSLCPSIIVESLDRLDV